MKKPKILAFGGSTREGSYNKCIVKVAVEGADKAGGEVTLVDLRDYPMPLYDADLEEREGLPEPAKRLKKLFVESDGLLIASPEYNSSITGVLKNTLDWVSREEPEDGGALVAYKGKVAAIMSASPGALGGLRSLTHLRALLENIGVMVLPEQKTLRNAYKVIDEKGEFLDEKGAPGFEELGVRLVEMLRKLM